jgi:hypothetical protein
MPQRGLTPDDLTAGQMSYDLRRHAPVGLPESRLHGLIERIAGSHRYRLTASGLRVALLFSRTYTRVLRPALSDVLSPSPPTADDSKLRRAFDQASTAIDNLIQQGQLAAA